MRDNPVLEAIRERRSIRRFKDEPVSRELVEQILEAGRWAPSGKNNQPWRFLVLMPGDGRIEPLSHCSKYAPIIKAAKALIVVVLDKGQMYHGVKDYQGAGACLQSMLLATHALGLGAVWIGEILGQEARVFEVLGLDGSAYELMAVVAVGRPEGKGGSSRKPLAELLVEPF